MPTHTTLKGVTHIGNSLISEQLEHNLAAFFTWGLLQTGAFFNVTLSSQGAFGGRQDQLRCVTEDPNYTEGQVWEGFRKDWVWESGIEYGYQPIQISGVYVNNVFHPKTDGTYYINYPQGQVVFETAQSVLDVITAEYSYRWVQIYAVSTIPYFQELQSNSFRLDSPYFMQQGSGLWSVLAQNRVQLPAVFVEAVPRQDFTPYQQGGGQIVDNDILFHIFTEDKWWKNQLTNAISQQHDKTIYLFDRNTLADNNAYPLDYNGSIASGAKCYPDLVENYFWKKAIFLNTYPQDLGVMNGIHRAVVRHSMRVIMPEI